MRLAAGRVALLLAVGLACTGCVPPESLGQLQGFTAQDLLSAPSVEMGIDASRDVAMALAGLLCLVTCMVSGYHIYFGGDGGSQGGDTQRWSRGFLVWTVISVALIGSMGRDNWMSIDWVLREIGTGLGNALRPDGDPYAKWVEGVVDTARLMLHLRELLSRGADNELTQQLLAAQAVAEWHTSWPGAVLDWINSVGVLFMKLMLQVSHAWLLAFYTMIGPLAALCLMTPWTRRIFWGYCRTYLAICLWPLLFAVAERVAQAVPFGYMFAVVRSAQTSTDPWMAAVAVGRGGVMMLVCNVLFFFVYLGIPIAAARLVNAAGVPFRNR